MDRSARSRPHRHRARPGSRDARLCRGDHRSHRHRCPETSEGRLDTRSRAATRPFPSCVSQARRHNAWRRALFAGAKGSPGLINDLWYKNAIIYCLSVGTYMDSNGDGIGDFPGLGRRLDYLQGVGVTAIWLNPFQPSPQRDDGYDVADYYGVDPRYGTLGDFVEFTHGCKQRGIRVLIDLVVNHTSDQHPWFQEARRDPKSKYRDWYVWSRRRPADSKSGVVFPGVQKSTWDARPGRPRILFPSVLRLPAGPQHRASGRAGGNPQDHGVLAAARRLRVPDGRGTLRHRREGSGRGQAGGALRHAAHIPRIPAVARGARG